MGIGLATLARSELALLLPALGVVVWTARRAWRSVAVVASASLLVVAPWVVANLVRFERPALLTTNDGVTLLGANCPDSWSGGDIGGWSFPCVVAAGGPPGEDPAVRSARLRSLAVDHVREHWERVPLVVAARVGRGLDVYGLTSLVEADVGEERWRWASWTGIVTWWVLAPAAAVGAVLTPRPARDVLLSPVVVTFVTIAAFYGLHRLRVGAEPSVVILAAVAFVALAQRWRAQRVAT